MKFFSRHGLHTCSLHVSSTYRKRSKHVYMHFYSRENTSSRSVQFFLKKIGTNPARAVNDFHTHRTTIPLADSKIGLSTFPRPLHANVMAVTLYRREITFIWCCGFHFISLPGYHVSELLGVNCIWCLELDGNDPHGKASE